MLFQTGLYIMDMASVTDAFLNILTSSGPKIVAGIVVFWLGRKITSFMGGAVHKALQNPNLKIDLSLAKFISSVVRAVLMLFVIMVSLSVIGVDISGLSAVVLGLGAAMAFILQGSLSDLAAGVMLMIFRPFKIGDEIEAGGIRGVISAIELSATRLRTRDNIEIIIQNSKLWGGTVRNHSAFALRRLDMVFGVDYAADLNLAIHTILSVAKKDVRIKNDPAPWAKVVNLGDSSVDIELRVWSEFKNIRDLKNELSQPMKAALDAAGINIPYPTEVKIKVAKTKSKSELKTKSNKTKLKST